MTITLEQIEAMRNALTEAEACMSIVEPRSDKAEYLRVLGVVRSALLGRKGSPSLTALSIADTVASEARAAIDMPGGENDREALTIRAETAEGIAAQFRAEGGNG